MDWIIELAKYASGPAAIIGFMQWSFFKLRDDVAVTAFSATNDLLVVIYTNAITAIGSLATGRAIGRGEK